MLTLLWASFRALSSDTGFAIWLIRCGLVCAVAVLVFSLADHWPRRLPGWAPRWVLQLVVVVLAMPPSVYVGYMLTLGTADVFALGPAYRNGWMTMSFMGMLLGPWIALAALLRQREAFAREQALVFELKRSELESKALDARLRLLQSQVEPHFLFNTLANVRALVRRSGSDEAADMLDCLIAYLRGAIPSLDASPATFAQELEMVRAYLELMRMRMPDRLAYAIDIDTPVHSLHCPPMSVLTLVENAVRHGIDPSERGGRITLHVGRKDHRVIVRVSDTGVGLQRGGEGLGIGLCNLRERLQLAFGDDARLELEPGAGGGTLATMAFPVHRADPA